MSLPSYLPAGGTQPPDDNEQREASQLPGPVDEV